MECNRLCTLVGTLHFGKEGGEGRGATFVGRKSEQGNYNGDLDNLVQSNVMNKCKTAATNFKHQLSLV